MTDTERPPLQLVPTGETGTPEGHPAEDQGYESKGPARGYSWPPFEAGNEAALRHGAKSPRRVDPLATELISAVLEEALREGSPTAYLTEVSYRAALAAWGRAEAQAYLLTQYLAKAGDETEDGVGDLDADRVTAAYRILHQAETRAANLRKQLGLDPLARARLGRDVAAASVDVAQLLARIAAASGDAS